MLASQSFNLRNEWKHPMPAVGGNMVAKPFFSSILTV
jgi:hypothetical protein